jgi:hypothetical protein
MPKITNIQNPSHLMESRLRANLELIEQIRADSINDIESLTEMCQHMTLVTESIQQNYQALLAQNQLLTSKLLSIIDECTCREGKRCGRCLEILKSLGGENLEPKPDAVQKYQTLLTKLRKLG